MNARASGPGEATAPDTGLDTGIEASVAVRVATVLVLLLLPLWTVYNRARGLGNSAEWSYARTGESALANVLTLQAYTWRDEGRVATLEELREGRLLDVTLNGGGRSALSRATFFDERVSDDGYTLSLVADEAPWVRVTGTITLSDFEITYDSSVDWIESASELDVWDYLLAGFGSLLAVVAAATWTRGHRWRRAFQGLALFVLAAWLLSLSFQPLVPRFHQPAPVLGDSTWTWM